MFKRIQKTEFNPRAPIYDPTATQTWWVGFMAGASIVFACLTVALILISFLYWRSYTQTTAYLLAVLWAIGAPAWFFCEYFFLYRRASAPNSWELFKHGQQVALAIWAGVTVALYTFGSSDLAKPKESKFECMPSASYSASSAGSGDPVLHLVCTSKK